MEGIYLDKESIGISTRGIMNLVFFRVGILILLPVIGSTGRTEKNKLKIIVPHKISYIHHHHQHKSHVIREKLSKPYYKTYLKTHSVYEGGDNKKDYENDDHFEFDERDEETDATRKGVLYYAIPATRIPKLGKTLLIKPLLIYKDDPSGMKQAKFRKSKGKNTSIYEESLHPVRYPKRVMESNSYGYRPADPEKFLDNDYEIDF